MLCFDDWVPSSIYSNDLELSFFLGPFRFHIRHIVGKSQSLLIFPLSTMRHILCDESWVWISRQGLSKALRFTLKSTNLDVPIHISCKLQKNLLWASLRRCWNAALWIPKWINEDQHWRGNVYVCISQLTWQLKYKDFFFSHFASHSITFPQRRGLTACLLWGRGEYETNKM